VTGNRDIPLKTELCDLESAAFVTILANIAPEREFLNKGVLLQRK